jgi:hypothetical protein
MYNIELFTNIDLVRNLLLCTLCTLYYKIIYTGMPERVSNTK